MLEMIAILETPFSFAATKEAREFVTRQTSLQKHKKLVLYV